MAFRSFVPFAPTYRPPVFSASRCNGAGRKLGLSIPIA
jgi:hypothetical protein